MIIIGGRASHPVSLVSRTFNMSLNPPTEGKFTIQKNEKRMVSAAMAGQFI